MIDFFAILIAITIAIVAIFKIRNEDVSRDLKIVLISFVVMIALVISGTVFWKHKPEQKPLPNIGENLTTNEPQFQPAIQNNPSYPISNVPTQPNFSMPNMTSEPVRNMTPSQTELVRTLLPSVFMIKTPNGSGSGFFINDGDIITNHHVLCGSTSANILMSNGQSYRIREVIAENVQADLIMVRADVPSSEIRPLRLKTTLPEVGENVFAIGSPLGLQNTVTNGIVSAIRSDGSISEVQISAPISPGSSGGPVVDVNGNVIGVAFKGKTKGQNLNFCIASEHIAAMRASSGYPLSQVASCSGPARRTQTRDMYCYLDSDGTVKFVEFPTETLISRPDGSLDRVKYHEWVLEKIGGNPESINPEKVTEDFIVSHRKEIFEKSFPNKVYGSSSMTLEEQKFFYNKLNMIRIEIYNRVVAKKNEKINRYRYMMQAFDNIAHQQSS